MDERPQGKKEQAIWISEKSIPRKGSSKCKDLGPGVGVGEHVRVFQEQQIESILSRTH